MKQHPINANRTSMCDALSIVIMAARALCVVPRSSGSRSSGSVGMSTFVPTDVEQSTGSVQFWGRSRRMLSLLSAK